MAVWSPSRLFAAAVVLALSAGAAGQSRQAQEHYQRGQRLQQNGMLGQAIAAYTQALDETPAYQDALRQRALAFREMGNAERALQDLNASLKLYPDDLDSLRNRAEIHLEAGRTREAIEKTIRAARISTYACHRSTRTGPPPMPRRAKLKRRSTITPQPSG